LDACRLHSSGPSYLPFGLWSANDKAFASPDTSCSPYPYT
jgi:hypothetical protein